MGYNRFGRSSYFLRVIILRLARLPLELEVVLPLAPDFLLQFGDLDACKLLLLCLHLFQHGEAMNLESYKSGKFTIRLKELVYRLDIGQYLRNSLFPR